jgi:hypothetical protein
VIVRHGLTARDCKIDIASKTDKTGAKFKMMKSFNLSDKSNEFLINRLVLPVYWTGPVSFRTSCGKNIYEKTNKNHTYCCHWFVDIIDTLYM